MIAFIGKFVLALAGDALCEWIRPTKYYSVTAKVKPPGSDAAYAAEMDFAGRRLPWLPALPADPKCLEVTCGDNAVLFDVLDWEVEEE